ncbi:MAG TPA: hypothetical protein VGQ77_14810 [Methylomirabilota bacterium]|jgi:hypothetical protein|nr:hypothetical protein [Methylomirabilota bacterium]
MEQAVAIAGAIMILVAYGANQAGWLDRTRPLYSGLNLVGSVLLTIIAWRAAQWGFVLLEGVWAVISVPPLLRGLRA